MKKIVAIDPGLQNTGFASVEFGEDGKVTDMRLLRFPVCSRDSMVLISLAKEFEDNIPLDVLGEIGDADIVLLEDQKAADRKMNHVMAHWLRTIPPHSQCEIVAPQSRSAYARRVLDEPIKKVSYRENKKRSIRAVHRLFPHIQLPKKEDDVADALLMCLMRGGYKLSSASDSGFSFSSSSSSVSAADARRSSLLVQSMLSQTDTGKGKT